MVPFTALGGSYSLIETREVRFDLVTVGRKCATSPTMKERVSRVKVATWLFSSMEDSMSLTASPD